MPKRLRGTKTEIIKRGAMRKNQEQRIAFSLSEMRNRRGILKIVPLYFAAERPEYKSVRFRTLGCYPLTGGIESTAHTLAEIVEETLGAVSSERTSRVIDKDGRQCGRWKSYSDRTYAL